MTGELDFIARLRAIASHDAARGLLDDAAVLRFGSRNLVLTQDAMIEHVHFLAADPPEDIGWKLAAVNLSDLAAKGARPLGALLTYSLAAEPEWDARFVDGLGEALRRYGCPLIGGDTVRAPQGSARQFDLTAIGEAETVPSRGGAVAGDDLWVSGTVGDAGLGLAIARGERSGPDGLVRAYRRPVPELALGRALAPLVHAMMDLSDGLLIDARRMAGASGVALVLEVEAIPLSAAYRELAGSDAAAALAAAATGDDYRLLFAAPPGDRSRIEAAAREADAPIHRIGRAEAGSGIRLEHGGRPVPLPERIGWEH